MPADLASNPQRLAIESIEPGEVLVVETGGELGAGVLGDILLSRVVKRGGALVHPRPGYGRGLTAGEPVGRGR